MTIPGVGGTARRSDTLSDASAAEAARRLPVACAAALAGPADRRRYAVQQAARFGASSDREISGP